MTDTPAGWRFEQTYAALPDVFHAAARPAPAKAPKLAVLNRPLAAELGLAADALTPELLAGQSLPPGGRFLAQAYAGHQFGGFTVLGDGRATLLGEHRTPAGRLVDVQFKGSGPTRFSRGGDGRAALGPMLREYIVSEAMHALGVPTTRSLAVATTGEPVFRETVKRGAVLTRVAASHLRVGTFEYAAALGDEPALRALADYAVARHDPDLAAASDRYLRFFRAVLGRQAALVARWQLVGFVHGVMNTDNMAVSGETIDYGPCAFMNAYDPGTVFSSIDRAGRYAYGNQPAVAQWNLARFAESLLPLFAPDQEDAIRLATAALDEFPGLFSGHWLAGMRRKLGLHTAAAGDQELADDLLAAMAAARADWTNTFAGLKPDASPADDGMAAWHTRWRDRLGRAGESPDATDALLRAANPRVVPRNHRVEEALAAAEDRDDFAPLHALLAAVTRPFEPAAGYTDPPADECGYRTFCGT